MAKAKNMLGKAKITARQKLLVERILPLQESLESNITKKELHYLKLKE